MNEVHIFCPLHLLWWLCKKPTSKNCLEIFSGQLAASVVEFLTLDPTIPAVTLTEAMTNVKITQSTQVYQKTPKFQAPMNKQNTLEARTL